MIVAPLVFTTLVVGIAKLGDIKSVGRIGAKTLLWFLGASFLSLLLGMLLVNIWQPGIHMHLPLPAANATVDIAQHAIGLKDFLYHVFPSSVIDAMAKNEILQVMDDLKAADVDFLTIGQYLQPSTKHYPLDRYYTPKEFDDLGTIAKAKGFLLVSSSPLTRSSYHADEDFAKLQQNRINQH